MTSEISNTAVPNANSPTANQRYCQAVSTNPINKTGSKRSVTPSILDNGPGGNARAPPPGAGALSDGARFVGSGATGLAPTPGSEFSADAGEASGHTHPLRSSGVVWRNLDPGFHALHTVPIDGTPDHMVTADDPGFQRCALTWLQPTRGHDLGNGEIVLERFIGRNLLASVSVFHSRMDDLIGQTIDPSDELLVFENLHSFRATGIELEFEVPATSRIPELGSAICLSLDSRSLSLLPHTRES